MANKSPISKDKVYFIGAGPGDCELITIKGHRILSQADIVIYAGSLINHELLDYCQPLADCYDSATMTLTEIIQVMVDGIRQGKLVVRLQTGDLSLYGSIREQIEELKKHHIDFVTVPGVSSFLGAAAELGVEYTVPNISQSLIITRMAGRTATPEGESIESFAAHRTSMAIFLSVQQIGLVVARLIDGGYPATTSAAVIYKATWPEQHSVKGTLQDITEKVSKAGITKTALILVGDFLGSTYHYSKLYAAEFSHEFRQSQ